MARSPSFLFLVAIGILLWGFPSEMSPQGMVTTSRTARPARPLPPGLEAPVVRYEDLAESAGLKAVSVSGAERRKSYIVETTGTGVALVDYDKDGLLDIFLVNADRFEPASERPTHHLYRNLGGLKFTEVTETSGLAHTGWGQGVCAGDIDNDEYNDLLITHWGQDVLFHNLRNGTFRNETKARGLVLPATRWSSGCSFFDYDRDGDLDLFIAHYARFDPGHTPKPGESAMCTWKGYPVLCGPRGLPGETMSLLQNDGRGFFTDVSEKAGVAGPKKYYGLTALSGDFDADGWPDMYVACDSTPSLLYRNMGDGTFEEIGLYSGAAFNEDGQEQAGMGAAAGDYDRDGLLDIVKTNFSSDTPNLYHNDGDGAFTEVTVAAGLAVNIRYLGWGTAFVDFDQDGWKDIFIANGHVYPEVDELPIEEHFKQQRLLYWNRRDGQFYDISAQAGSGILASHASRGIAVGDLDNDGDVEIVVVNMHEPPSLLKNFGDKGNSLLVRALTGSGRDAVGARITVASKAGKQTNEVRSGGYHISQGDFRVHFGLGAETTADITIRWLGGKSETFSGIAANQLVVIQEGKGVVRTQKFLRETSRAPVTTQPASSD